MIPHLEPAANKDGKLARNDLSDRLALAYN
jgi:hypothetical protein